MHKDRQKDNNFMAEVSSRQEKIQECDDELSCDDTDAETETSLKVVLLGDSGGGKTSLCRKFAQHSFNAKYTPTAGVDFYSRRITLPSKTSVLIQLWDVAGQSINSTTMLRTYVFGANAVLFVYDVTNTQCFENIYDWVGAIKTVIDASKTFGMFLVGTKTDLEHRRSVSIERNNGAADQHNLEYFYVSAKTGDNVELLFKTITSRLLGVKMTRGEQEWDIGVVQAPIVSDSAQCRPRQPYQSPHYKSPVGNSTTLTPLTHNKISNQLRGHSTKDEAPVTLSKPPLPTAITRFLPSSTQTRNSAVCTIS